MQKHKAKRQIETASEKPHSNVSDQPTILKTLVYVSVFFSVLFIALSYLFHQLSYYLLTFFSLITLYFSVSSFPRKNSEPKPVLVLLLSLSYQLLIVLLASVFTSFHGIPYAIIALSMALMISSTIPLSSLSDWIVTIGVLGAIASVQLSLLSILPQVNNQALSSIVLLIAVILFIKITEMVGERRIVASIRTKLLLISLALTLSPLIILSVINGLFLQRSIQARADETLSSFAARTASSVDDFIIDHQQSLRDEPIITAAQNYLSLSPSSRLDSIDESVLIKTFQVLSAKDSMHMPSYALMDKTGTVLLSINKHIIGSRFSETSEFNEAIKISSAYVSHVIFDATTPAGSLFFINPVNNASGETLGFVGSRFDSTVLQSTLSNNAKLLGSGAYPILIDENGLRLADALSPLDINRLIAPISREQFEQLVSQQRIPQNIPYDEISVVQPDLESAILNFHNAHNFTANLKIQDKLLAFSGSMVESKVKPWTVVYLQESAVVSSALRTQNRLTTSIGLLVAAFISLFVVLASSRFTKPIIELTQASKRIANGDLSVQANITSEDEIGILGRSFNSMAMQVKTLVGSLENQVSERTQQLSKQNEVLQLRSRQLQTVADVARSIVSNRHLDPLLDQVTKLISERFGYYHTGIFLLDGKDEIGVLRASNSNRGNQMISENYGLRVGDESLAGSVSATGLPQIATITNETAKFINASDMPSTQSEMALPLKLDEEVIGTLDIHSLEPDAFSQEDLALFTTLADQISVAIDNANAYEISQKSLIEMKELDRVKSQFLSNMSHELRTPLNSVIGFSRVILKGIDGPINETQTQDITSIYNSGLHLLNLINEILDQSKIEAGKMELHIEEMNVQELVSRVMETASGLVKEKPIQLIAQVAPDLPDVAADEIRIEQVLVNLVSNAVKFTDQGTITISANKQLTLRNREEVVFRVADTGIGIHTKDQPKLFQQFSQVDDTSTRRSGGTGLGLSISRSLVELHGGEIGLESSVPGEGSVFYFTIPLPTSESANQLLPTQDGRKTVLAIDDDAQVITLYERFLNPHGFDVVPLTNPNLAVAYAKEIKPFAITLDIMMPEKDGWQVLNDLKMDEETRQIPVLVCSIMEEMEKGFKLGASDYLVKPFIHNELVNAINKLIKDKEIRNILIIDDDPQYLTLMKEMILNHFDFPPIVAEGGMEALKRLEETSPDVILMDLVLEDINGFELLEKFSSDPRIKRIPLIILTSSDISSEEIAKLGEFGDQVINKFSITKKDLLENLHDALKQLRPDPSD